VQTLGGMSVQSKPMLVRGMGIELVGDTLAKLLAPGGRQAAGGKRSSHRL